MLFKGKPTTGFELYSIPPLQIDVVKETRPYPHWASSPPSMTKVGIRTGIMAAKAELNALHRYLAEQGFTEVRQLP